jgi:transcriptional regulator with XRE-family HTH domain
MMVDWVPMETPTLPAGGPLLAKDLPHIGARLKALREAAALSQQQLAFRAGVSVSMVSHIEQGQKKDVRLSTLVTLAEALGLDVGRLALELTRPEEEKPPAKRRKKTGN